MNANFQFLTSVRFWKIVGAFLAEALGFYGLIPAEIAHTIAGILGVSVAVRTVDRFGETISK